MLYADDSFMSGGLQAFGMAAKKTQREMGAGGVLPPEVEKVKALIETFKADLVKGKYGSVYTKTEQAIGNNWIPGSLGARKGIVTAQLKSLEDLAQQEAEGIINMQSKPINRAVLQQQFLSVVGGTQQKDAKPNPLADGFDVVVKDGVTTWQPRKQ